MSGQGSVPQGLADAVQALHPLQFPLWGSRLIEASAGTGKTYTIAALYLRLVLQHGAGNAYGRPLVPPEILVVTFTDAATQELRDRIRQRLAEAAELFGRDPADTIGLDAVDPLLLALRADYPDAQWPGCARRLREAANWMDEAAVSTIHSWCYRMLREHAFDSGSLFQQQLVTDQTELLTQVVQDYWRTQFYGLPASALRSLQTVVASPAALQDALQGMLARQEAEWQFEGQALPASAEVDVAALLNQAAEQAERCEQLQAVARDAWRAHRADLEQLFATLLPHFNGTTYPKKDEEGVFDGWMAGMAAWSEGADAPAKIRAFSQSGIRLKKGANVPTHTALAALDDWLAADGEALPAAAQIKPLLLRHALGHVRRALNAEKQRRAELGFDDLLQRLDAALQAEGGEALAARIRAQFPVAMIDEFQDTDPLQYRIFERVYAIDANDAALGFFMIGDPKQAIYAFRGADIYTYLRARAATAGRHYSLGTNYRSTTAVVDVVNHCFAHAEGHDSGAFRFRQGGANPVPFVPVGANGRRDGLFLEGAPQPAMTLWTVLAPEREADGEGAEGAGGAEDAAASAASTRTGVPEGQYRRRMAASAAAQITEWLNAAQRGQAGFGTGPDALQRALRPADIAVLVRGRAEAELVREQLALRGLASVYLSDRDSVFQTAEAADMLRWLRAVHAPSDDGLLRAALATAAMGWSWQALDRLNHDEQHWEQLALRMRALQQLWQKKGVLPMLRQWLLDFDLPARWLAQAGGERRLTNVLHLAEWLQRTSAAVDGEQALMRALAEQMARPEGDEEILHLESDADLIKIVTIHKSKGLEYPLVLLPFISSWRDFDGKSRGYAQFHDAATGALVVELSNRYAPAVAGHNDERLSEDMRLLYVALTRAQYALWLGIAPIAKGSSKAGTLEKSAVGYLLAGGNKLPDATLGATLQAFAQGCTGMAVQPLPPATSPDAVRYTPPPAPALHAPRQPQRRYDEHWWIASFSALTDKLGPVGAVGPVGDVAGLAPQPVDAIDFDALAQDGRVPEPETAQEDQYLELQDVAPDTPGATLPVRPAAAEPGSLHAFPKGPDAGNFLHGMLEWCAQEGFGTVLAQPAQLDSLIAHRCKVRGWADWAEPLQGIVRQWLQAPLVLQGEAGPSLAELAQWQVEMEFWLPVVGQASSAQLNALVQQHIAPGQPRPALAYNRLHGMLKGYMDLVLEHGGRYYVLDYKSNWLGTDSTAYTPAAMQAAVLQHRYDVQYVIYTYALHRLLQLRLPGYDYERDVGGVVYWFLRGVDAAGAGMYADKPPRALMDALDALWAAP
ncbi:exodeoxyribonuclease V subunit beta [Comamonas sp. 4034]|uniref:exodeoxyribonuclease V subunit beta n=1 Tax=Comamonas sp. 4034 TaxID=3156455 RepID=UPI003D22C99F